jgi:hypothetical protein
MAGWAAFETSARTAGFPAGPEASFKAPQSVLSCSSAYAMEFPPPVIILQSQNFSLSHRQGKVNGHGEDQSGHQGPKSLECGRPVRVKPALRAIFKGRKSKSLYQLTGKGGIVVLILTRQILSKPSRITRRM